MQQGLIIFFVSVFLGIGFVVAKYFLHKKDILEINNNIESGNNNIKLNKSLEDTKDLVFAFFDDIRNIVEKNLKIFLHWILHMFVIVLGFISDLTDFIYFKARDFFLKTATKERDVVTTFWHHLKQYKREKEEGK